MTKFYTYKDDVPLSGGQTLAFTPGKGYYAEGEPSILASMAHNAVNKAVAVTAAKETAQGAVQNVGEPPAAPAKPQGQASAATPDTAVDWRAYLSEFGGMPDNLVDEIEAVYKRTSDIQQTVAIAQAIVRGSEWYSQHFPGIQDGINKGLYSDERGYRAYQNQLDQLYLQYYGRPSTPAEVATASRSGKSMSQIANGLQSAATKGNLSDPMRQWFSSAELTAYANQVAGIDSELGQRIAAEADVAVRVNSLYKDFFGRDVNRLEIDALIKDGTDPAQVAKWFATQSNINGMNPAVSHLFSADEIREMALEQAGGVTQNGKKLLDMADLARSLNSVYHTYTGAGVTRDEVMSAYTGGLTADEVQRQLEAGTISGSLPAYLKDIFGPEDVGLVGREIAGASSSAEGKRLQQLMQSAPAYNEVFQQYQGRQVTKDELSSLVDQGVTAQVAAQKFQGQSIANVNRNDFQYALGNFGEGQLSDAQLTALGQEQAGYDTPLGQQLLASYQKAQKRIQGAFGRVLASPALSLSDGRLSSGRKRPDVGA